MGVGTLYGVNATLIAAGGESAILQGMVDARVKVMIDTYVTVGSSEDIGTTIQMGSVLPKGARIIDVVLLTSASLGSGSTTIAVGDTNSSARYISAVTCSGATLTRLNTFAGFNYIIGTSSTTDDTKILLTTAGANNTTASVNIAVYVFYALD